MLEILTQGLRMVGADGFTELFRPQPKYESWLFRSFLK